MRRILRSTNAPTFDLSPISQGVETDELVFVVGMAVDEKTGTRMREAVTIEDETRIALEAIGTVLAEAGCSLEDVVKTTVYLAERAYYDEMNRIYRQFWPEGHEPVRCSLFVGIGADCRVEIDAVAAKPHNRD